MSELPLEGIKVLDLSRVLAGPYCSLQLADLGAEVVKLEVPGRGDDSRHFGPFIEGESSYFLSLNRNKKSITLDLKSNEGRSIFKELIKEYDVLVENFRPGTMEKLGLGYEELSELNPGLIYAGVSGFGATGPDTQKPAYDIVVQGRGGIMSITGQENGEPTRVGASIGDTSAGLFAAISILSALLVVRTTGRGQKIDISMLDTQVALLENAIARYSVTGEVPGPLGNRHPSITPFSSFKTKDGYVIAAAGNDNLWERLCRVLDMPELTEDERFNTNERRTENWEELKTILESAFQKEGSAYWIEALEEENIPCSLIQDIAQLMNDPQVLARDMIEDIPLSSGEKLSVAGIPYKLSGSSCGVFRAPPQLGEHTEEILGKSLNMDDHELTQLKEKGVI